MVFFVSFHLQSLKRLSGLHRSLGKCCSHCPLSPDTMFEQTFAAAQVPALFGAAIGVFAVASTLFFFIHAAMQKEDRVDESARSEAIELERRDDAAR